ncbi:MAG: hypothetical protein ACJAW1_003539 [Glaciecola sp.]
MFPIYVNRYLGDSIDMDLITVLIFFNSHGDEHQ